MRQVEGKGNIFWLEWVCFNSKIEITWRKENFTSVKILITKQTHNQCSYNNYIKTNTNRQNKMPEPKLSTKLSKVTTPLSKNKSKSTNNFPWISSLQQSREKEQSLSAWKAGEPNKTKCTTGQSSWIGNRGEKPLVWRKQIFAITWQRSINIRANQNYEGRGMNTKREQVSKSVML